MRTLITTLALCAAPLLLAALAGCTTPSQPSRFYRLDSQLPPTPMPESRSGDHAMPMVGVGPVVLASYLDRPQLVERSAGYRLDLHEFDRWAGTLQENIIQVLANGMQQRLPRAQVIGYPWNASVRPDYEVMLYVSRFDRERERVRLQARWSLVGSKDGRLLRLEQSEIEIALEGAGIEAVVAASSKALQQLAVQITDRLPPLKAAQR